MADEQDEWLDEEAAESLLRGEPVVPLDAPARAAALRLARALDEARAHRPQGGLRGEEAALAAFREAAGTPGKRRSAAQRPLTVRAVSPSVGMELPDPVRLGVAPPARRRRMRRSVRYGLVVSLAGCALGGVAVATGAGVLPGPFGGHGTAAPAASVSAPAPSGVPDGAKTSGRPGDPSETGAPGTGGATGAPGSAGAGNDGSTPGSGTFGGTGDRPLLGGSGSATGGSGTGRDGTVDGPDRAGDAARDGAPGASRSPSGGDWLTAATQQCRDYRDGDLGAAERRRLVRTAGGESSLERRCDRLLGDDDGRSTDGSRGGAGADGDREDDGPHDDGPRDLGDGSVRNSRAEKEYGPSGARAGVRRTVAPPGGASAGRGGPGETSADGRVTSTRTAVFTRTAVTGRR
ncbi:hypothetical protein [uncultured Streptomyces sp.]|uniref:hypothetical protein n=1 Tax=uncultured Streptomyces sp. TaxID=174707 RepID=UPI0026379963|nr:hypothetical protein [uncultured Streptomyces sp.]